MVCAVCVALLSLRVGGAQAYPVFEAVMRLPSPEANV